MLMLFLLLADVSLHRGRFLGLLDSLPHGDDHNHLRFGKGKGKFCCFLRRSQNIGAILNCILYSMQPKRQFYLQLLFSTVRGGPHERHILLRHVERTHQSAHLRRISHQGCCNSPSKALRCTCWGTKALCARQREIRGHRMGDGRRLRRGGNAVNGHNPQNR